MPVRGGRWWEIKSAEMSSQSDDGWEGGAGGQAGDRTAGNWGEIISLSAQITHQDLGILSLSAIINNCILI